MRQEHSNYASKEEKNRVRSERNYALAYSLSSAPHRNPTKQARGSPLARTLATFMLVVAFTHTNLRNYPTGAFLVTWMRTARAAGGGGFSLCFQCLQRGAGIKTAVENIKLF